MLAPLRRFVLIPVLTAIIGIIIVGRVTDWWTGPDSYYIHLVGDFRNEPAIARIFEGFLGASCEKSDGEIIRDNGIAGVPVRVKCLDDRGDSAEARRISADLAQRDDTLMVIGHVYSTLTKEALPNYLRQAQPAIPVILTAETNPQLIPAKKTGGDYDPVFRLAPTDDEQATTAAQFAINNAKQILWVVEDERNPVYSKYLALEFVRRVQEKEGKVVLWSTNMSVPPAETLNKLKIDFVFFSGDWSNALILIRQIKRIFPPDRMPMLFLSDAAVDPQLLKHGGDDLYGLNVHLGYPLKATQFKGSGFELFGKDARSIIDRLLVDTDQHFVEESQARSRFRYWSMLLLNRHEVADARFALKSRMMKTVLEERAFPGILGEYQFGHNGNNKQAQWHIWKVQKEKGAYQFVDVE
ncbi:MAG: ABC transporter substrate-binding protein [Gammaproteobacteria bacterium]|nr:ABC transporter substrate-binding protein [Gammaproteobacteria bacterium]